MNVALRTRGMRGMGDAGEDFWDSFFGTGSGETSSEGSGLPGGAIDYSSGETANGDTTTLILGGGYAGAPTPGGGYATVKPIPGSTGLDAAALLKAVTAGTLVLSRINPGTGLPVCPSGYQKPDGSCLPVASAASKPLISGVSNQTLGLLALGVVALLALGGKK